MWSGRIVPLFRFPLVKGTNLTDQSEEERSLPLPSDLCVGMNTNDGSSFWVTYGLNPSLPELSIEAGKKVGEAAEEGPDTWGDDLAGWLAIAPFPPTLFKTNRLVRLGVHVRNVLNSFQEGVTAPLFQGGCVFLAMEVLGCGDMGSLVLLPPDNKPEGEKPSLEEREEKLKEDLEKHEKVRAAGYAEWKKGGVPKKDWLFNLFNGGEFTPVEWATERRVIVRDQQITVPYAEFWRKLQLRYPEVESKIVPSDYCLLARDMELPVLLALFPTRPLFRVDLSVATQEAPLGRGAAQIGGGMLDRVVSELSSRKINIWHIKSTPSSLMFDKNSQREEDYILRSIEGRISIVASVPQERQRDRPEVISAYLKDLRRKLSRLRRNPSEQQEEELMSKLRAGLEEAPEQIIRDLRKHLRSMPDKDLRLVGGQAKEARLRQILKRNLDDLAERLIEPSFIKDVDVHGPPLFRCFFSHSARPAYDERDHIDRLKLLLESEVFEVIEGEFSLGLSTEALSRDRIRHCDLFVSFLWPRDDFHTDKGEYLPPEWVIHEESFAIGQGLPVYRVRERTVANPRYERDRLDLEFAKGNVDSWNNLEQRFRLEIRQLALQILLGVRPAAVRGHQDDKE